MNASAKVTNNKITTQSPPEVSPVCRVIDPQTRRELIAQAAYFRAQHRGFLPGHEQEDWCAAEMEVDDAQNASAKT